MSYIKTHTRDTLVCGHTASKSVLPIYHPTLVGENCYFFTNDSIPKLGSLLIN